MDSAEKILVAGSEGLLGSEFRELALSPLLKGQKLVALSRRELDIADPDLVHRAFETLRPAYAINCAAYTNVDGAESNPVQADKANREGPRNLAQACLKYGAKLIHYSTDFVFDGNKREPYVESDPPSPLNVYAQSKWEGEKEVGSILSPDRHLILRISWPYGKNGKNFIHTLWELSKRQGEIKVVTDQVGIPNPARLLAEKTLDLLEEASGLFHLSCTGSCSRYELIRFLLEELKSPCAVRPALSGEFPSPARRPAYSALGTEREDLALKTAMPHWKSALQAYLKGREWK